MKKKWIEEFDAITRIVNVNDPLGLIGAGAPEDEYEMETLEIFTKRRSGLLSGDSCFDEVMEIFLRKFGEDSAIDKESIRIISDGILNLE